MRALLCVFCCLWPFFVFAEDLGQFGKTYEIKERDLLEEIEERASKVDWDSLRNDAKKQLEANIGNVDKVLPKAKDNSSYYVDLTTKLEYPVYVRDERGNPKLLYPKGYKFNALDYVSLHQRYVFFDATRPEEIEWYKSVFFEDANTMPIISRGNALELAKKIGREVYALDDEMIRQLKLKVTPTFVYQYGSVLKADEFYIPVEKAEGEQP